MSKFLININGEFFDESNAKISIFDRGFLYGDSVYEATRTFNRIPFRLDKHLDRLFVSCSKLDFVPRISKEHIKSQVIKTIEKSPFEDILIRIILSRGTNIDLGLNPELSLSDNLVIISKEIKNHPRALYENGVAIISYYKKSSSLGSYSKSGNYQENVMAMKKAEESKSFEALMINAKNFVTECSTSNIWLVKDGVVKTPHIEDGLLEGLTRKALINICIEHKIPLVEANLSIDDFYHADEVFLTSTNRDLVPVIKIDNILINKGKVGNLSLKLLDMYLFSTRGVHF